MEKLDYTVILEPNDEGKGYTASVPALPGCISVGDTEDKALENIKDAIALWVKMAQNKGEQIPQDNVIISKVSVPV